MKAFLETTVQIERVLASPTRQNEWTERLAEKPLATSSYVWMEFRRTVLQATAYVSHVITTFEREGRRDLSFSELAHRLAEGQAIGFAPRTSARVWRVYAALLDDLNRIVVPVQTLQEALTFYCDWLWPRRFFAGIAEYVTSTDCDLVKPGATLGNYVRSRLSCNARTASCALVPFLKSHAEKLKALEEAMSAGDPRAFDPATRIALQRVLADPHRALGERTCWALGDVLIALEVPDDTVLYTTDHHFELIASTLGLKLCLAP